MAIKIAGETIALVSPGPSIEISIDNIEDLDQLPSIILRDLNSSTMFRFVASSSSLKIQSKTSSQDWDDATDLIEYSDEIEQAQFSEEYLNDLLDSFLLHLAGGGEVGLRLKNLVHHTIMA